MKNYFANIIIKSIKKVIGNGPHQLHEPLFIGNEINRIRDSSIYNGWRQLLCIPIHWYHRQCLPNGRLFQYRLHLDESLHKIITKVRLL
jgi:hypothetical protein